jgi:tetratricopeptide (TPR) repeat protein
MRSFKRMPVPAAVVAAVAVPVALLVASPAGVTRAAAAPAAPTVPPPASDAARREEAKAAFGRGNTAYNLGKYDEAIREFEKAYALSRLPDILFNLGQCYRKQWEADRRSELGRRALHYYEALVREAPSSRVRPDADQFIAELGPAVAAAEAQERQGQIAAARGGDALKLAQSMFAAGQLTDASGVLDRLLREPDNGRELLAEAYLLRGRVAAGTGDLLGAEVQFRRAAELRPSAEIPDPRGQEAAALEAARKTVAAGGLRLVQSPVGEVAPGAPARVEVKVEGDSEKMVATLELGYRGADTGAFLTARAKPPVPLEVPATALGAGARVDYYVRALDEHGSVLAESGAPSLPFRLQVADPAALAARTAASRPTPWYQRWWVWTIVGAVAIGAGAVTYVETRPESLLTFSGRTQN